MTLEEFARKGGNARRDSLTKEQRLEIALKANKARWDKAKKGKRKAA